MKMIEKCDIIDVVVYEFLCLLNKFETLSPLFCTEVFHNYIFHVEFYCACIANVYIRIMVLGFAPNDNLFLGLLYSMRSNSSRALSSQDHIYLFYGIE